MCLNMILELQAHYSIVTRCSLASVLSLKRHCLDACMWKWERNLKSWLFTIPRRAFFPPLCKCQWSQQHLEQALAAVGVQPWLSPAGWLRWKVVQESLGVLQGSYLRLLQYELDSSLALHSLNWILFGVVSGVSFKLTNKEWLCL